MSKNSPTQRRTSTLKGRSPANPQPPREAAEQAPTRPQVAPEPVPEAPRATPPAEKAHGERIYLKPSEKARAEAAMYATLRETGMRPSFSSFAVTAIQQLTEQLEAQYNDGKPF